MTTKQTICLTMIVKDESHIIRDTLTKLLAKIQIDYWVICDTGSSDTTKQIITEFFAERGISGELVDSPWVNFAHNRTVAFQNAYKKSDYVFVWDADDEIIGNLELPTPLTADWYKFQFGSGTTYVRPQLFKNTLKWKYVSVLHEYAICEEPVENPVFVPGAYHFVSGRSGNRSKDPNKYLKDATILEKAYHECIETKDPMYNRYAFYCAGSWRDCGQHEKAIEFYKKVLGHENWSEEKYISCLNLYESYKVLGREEEGLGYLVKSHTYNSRRVEGILKLIIHYCCEKQNGIALNYYQLIQNFFENEYEPEKGKDWLFVNRPDYEFLLPYYMIIIADKMGRKETGAKMYELVCRFQQTNISEFHINNWIYNAQFFLDYLPKTREFITLFTTYIEKLEKCGKNISIQCKGIVENIIRSLKSKCPEMAINAIPKRIYQTFESNSFSTQFQTIVDSWKRHNPTYEYVFYNAKDREDFIKTNFEWSVYDAYCRIIPGAYKADLWRYCILYMYGGVYVDIDTLCFGSLDNFITPDIELMVPIDLNPGDDGYYNLSNGFIASIPKLPVLKNCIDRIVRNVEQERIPRSKLDFSGPGLLGRSVNTYLGRDEESSFVGQEGTLGNIRFLKFERGIEYVKHGDTILFQNKNGNPELSWLYHLETTKAKTICWVNTTTILRPKTENRIAVLIYGGFRSYSLNLKRNINELLSGVVCPVDFYILTDTEKEFESKQKEITEIIQSFGFNVNYFGRIQSCVYHNKDEEEDFVKNFVSIESRCIKDSFTPRLFFRRCVLNDIMNSYNVKYTKVIFSRLFDMVMKRFKPLTFINDTSDSKFYYGIDSTFIGTQNDMNKMFAKQYISKAVHVQEESMDAFRKFFKDNDAFLAGDMPRSELALETIYNKIIFNNFSKNCVNLRFDISKGVATKICEAGIRNAEDICKFVVPYVTSDYLFLWHCMYRKEYDI